MFGAGRQSQISNCSRNNERNNHNNSNLLNQSKLSTTSGRVNWAAKYVN